MNSALDRIISSMKELKKRYDSCITASKIAGAETSLNENKDAINILLPATIRVLRTINYIPEQFIAQAIQELEGARLKRKDDVYAINLKKLKIDSAINHLSSGLSKAA